MSTKVSPLSGFRILGQFVDTLNADDADFLDDVDVRDYRGVLVDCFITNQTSSSQTYTGSIYKEFELQHSNDGSTYNDVGADDIERPAGQTGAHSYTVLRLGAALAAGAIVRQQLAYVGPRRYLRVKFAVTGTQPGAAVVGAAAYGFNPRVASRG